MTKTEGSLKCDKILRQVGMSKETLDPADNLGKTEIFVDMKLRRTQRTNVQVGRKQLMFSSLSKISLCVRDVEKMEKHDIFCCCFKQNDVAFLWCNVVKITATHAGVNLLEIYQSSQTCRIIMQNIKMCLRLWIESHVSTVCSAFSVCFKIILSHKATRGLRKARDGSTGLKSAADFISYKLPET